MVGEGWVRAADPIVGNVLERVATGFNKASYGSDTECSYKERDVEAASSPFRIVLYKDYSSNMMGGGDRGVKGEGTEGNS